MPRPSIRPDVRKVETVPNVIENGAVREWINLRKSALLDKVSAHDVLRQFGVNLRFSGSSQSEQILCPFHDDSRPSAKVYPSEGGKPSKFYCFTCRGKALDIFALWANFKGDPDMKFTQVLRGLEETFGLETPEPPARGNEAYESLRGPSEEDLEVKDLLGVCERRLRDAKPSFKLEGFLVVGQCLDRLHYRIEKGLLKTAEARVIIRKVLDKISEKMRASPA
jgi:hypothetical protein